MPCKARVLVPLALAVAVSLSALGAGAALGAPPIEPGMDFGLNHRPVCPPVPQALRCHSEVVTDASGKPLATTSYTSGYGPADLAGAYKYTEPAGATWAWNGQTIAIVDAYDNPNAEADLAVYRTRFGLPPCTSANVCFRKADQRGGTAYPAGNVGWGREIALDLDMASAVCPLCKILLVEADTNSFANLAAAVDRAVVLGATVVSNSYGAPEFNGEASLESHYNHPGTAITVSSGDSGYGVQYPAASQYVTAVGGTKLTKATATARGWSETAWSGAGSGCSGYIPKPLWQIDTATCGRRTVADVAAVADPATGVAVYDSYGSTGGANWYVFGGTSVAAPIVAGIYGLAANAASVTYGAYPYAHASSLFDVTSGSNGRCTTSPKTAVKAYLCTAGAGYDGPTGLGTPNGVLGF